MSGRVPRRYPEVGVPPCIIFEVHWADAKTQTPGLVDVISTFIFESLRQGPSSFPCCQPQDCSSALPGRARGERVRSIRIATIPGPSTGTARGRLRRAAPAAEEEGVYPQSANGPHEELYPFRIVPSPSPNANTSVWLVGGLVGKDDGILRPQPVGLPERERSRSNGGGLCPRPRLPALPHTSGVAIGCWLMLLRVPGRTELSGARRHDGPLAANTQAC